MDTQPSDSLLAGLSIVVDAVVTKAQPQPETKEQE